MRGLLQKYDREIEVKNPMKVSFVGFVLFLKIFLEISRRADQFKG